MLTPTTDIQREQCLRLWRNSFFVDDRWCEQFRELVGWEIVRCAESDGQVAASVAVHDFGQFFGGSRLASAGIALVACAPEFRSRGVTRRLMSDMLREQHAAGVPLSALYPSTRTLYRKLGYETTGRFFRYSVPLNRIDVGRVPGEVRPLEDGDLDLVKDLYGRWARSMAGLLDRNEFLWRRVVHARDGKKRTGYLITIDGEPRGYFYYLPGEAKDFNFRPVEVWDLVALDAAAGRRFLAFMFDLRTTLDEMTMWAIHNDPVLMLLNEQRFETTLDNAWMMRIIDVPRALRERGYPAGIEAELHLTIHSDDIIQSNNGRFVLRVREGEAEVDAAPGRRAADSNGVHEVTISIRGLVSLFSGHLSAIELAQAGLLESSGPKALSLATALFSGPQPRLADGF